MKSPGQLADSDNRWFLRFGRKSRPAGRERNRSATEGRFRSVGGRPAARWSMSDSAAAPTPPSKGLPSKARWFLGLDEVNNNNNNNNSGGVANEEEVELRNLPRKGTVSLVDRVKNGDSRW